MTIKNETMLNTDTRLLSKFIRVRVYEDQKTDFEKICKKMDKDMSVILRDLLDNFIEENKDILESENINDSL